MGRAKGKRKKLTVTNDNDNESGEEEKVPAQKRRGRPQKLLKDEIDEGVSEKVEVKDSEDSEIGLSSKTTKLSSAENGKKGKRNALSKEKIDSKLEENGNRTRSVSGESSKYNGGFRSNGNRRKNKPCRAAEAGVECL